MNFKTCRNINNMKKTAFTILTTVLSLVNYAQNIGVNSAGATPLRRICNPSEN